MILWHAPAARVKTTTAMSMRHESSSQAAKLINVKISTWAALSPEGPWNTWKPPVWLRQEQILLWRDISWSLTIGHVHLICFFKMLKSMKPEDLYRTQILKVWLVYSPHMSDTWQDSQVLQLAQYQHEAVPDNLLLWQLILQLLQLAAPMSSLQLRLQARPLANNKIESSMILYIICKYK